MIKRPKISKKDKVSEAAVCLLGGAAILEAVASAKNHGNPDLGFIILIALVAVGLGSVSEDHVAHRIARNLPAKEATRYIIDCYGIAAVTSAGVLAAGAAMLIHK